MYITKIEVDMTRSKNYLGFTDIGYFHSVLENCFEGEREHPLWQIAGNNILMVSKRIPAVPEWFGKAQTKEYNPNIPENTILHYCITANPTIKKNGKRIPLNVNRTRAHPYCVTDWLQDRLRVNGAEVLVVNVSENKTIKAKGGKAKFFAVTFDGVLIVKDKKKFENALISGVGHEKAYGCGLLLVKK